MRTSRRQSVDDTEHRRAATDLVIRNQPTLSPMKADFRLKDQREDSKTFKLEYGSNETRVVSRHRRAFSSYRRKRCSTLDASAFYVVRHRKIINFSLEKRKQPGHRETKEERTDINAVARGFVCGRRHDTRYPSFEQRAGIKTDSSSSALRMSIVGFIASDTTKANNQRKDKRR